MNNFAFDYRYWLSSCCVRCSAGWTTGWTSPYLRSEIWRRRPGKWPASAYCYVVVTSTTGCSVFLIPMVYTSYNGWSSNDFGNSVFDIAYLMICIFLTSNNKREKNGLEAVYHPQIGRNGAKGIKKVKDKIQKWGQTDLGCEWGCKKGRKANGYALGFPPKWGILNGRIYVFENCRRCRYNPHISAICALKRPRDMRIKTADCACASELYA